MAASARRRRDRRSRPRARLPGQGRGLQAARLVGLARLPHRLGLGQPAPPAVREPSGGRRGGAPGGAGRSARRRPERGARDGARDGPGADRRRNRQRRSDRPGPSEDARSDARRSRDVLSDTRRSRADGNGRQDRRRALARALLQHPARRRRGDRDQPADLDDRLPGGSEPPVPRRQARARRDRRRRARGLRRAGAPHAQGPPLLRPGRVGRVMDRIDPPAEPGLARRSSLPTA